jgi:hypothetical protein
LYRVYLRLHKQKATVPAALFFHFTITVKIVFCCESTVSGE